MNIRIVAEISKLEEVGDERTNTGPLATSAAAR
jgi:hypothetical protein